MFRILLVLLFFAFEYAYAQSLNDSLMVHYRLDANATDLGGHDMHGTVYGASAMTDRFGQSERAYFFDGIDDQIELPGGDELRPDLPLSISFWVYLEDSSDINNALLTTNDHPDKYSGVGVRTDPDGSGTLVASLGDGRGAGSQFRRSVHSSFVLNSRRWYHIVFIARTSTDMDIFINGQKDEAVTYSGTGNQLAYFDMPGKLGGYDGGPLNTRFFNGGLDELLIWNRALTQKEAGLLYSGLLIDTKMDGKVLDISGNGFHGISHELTTTTDRFGQEGAAIQFDGEQSYVELPGHHRFKSPLPVSFSLYVYSDTFQSQSCIFFDSDDHPDLYSGWTIRTDNSGGGRPVLSYGDGRGSGPPNRQTCVGSTALENGKWYHLAGVIRGPRDMTLFVNGVKDTLTYSGSGRGLAYTTYPGKLGSSDGSTSVNSRFFDGKLDDFQLWHADLPDEALIALYQPGTTTSTSDWPEQHKPVQLMPNPVDDFLEIHLPDGQEAESISIFNLSGKLIRHQMVAGNRLTGLQDLSGGPYLIQIQNGPFVWQQLIIKK